MNKKGATISVGFVVAIFLAIVFLTFLTGGGFSLILNMTRLIKSIPTIAWVILGIIILFKVIK